jgi:CheY-like chemotaxis protein
MDHLQKTFTKTGDEKIRIDKTNRQETYRLFHCDTVLQAWNLVYRHRPHLIVLNLGNLESGGLSALQECRVLAGRVPIIVVAPSQLRQPLAEALEHQVVAVIPASSIARSVSKALQSLV